MMSMTPRERIFAIFKGQKPDGVPWFADLSYWHLAEQTRGTLPEEYRNEAGLARLHRDLNCGFYLQPVNPYQIESEVMIITTQEDLRTIRILKTPVGELREIQIYLPDSFTWAYEEHWIKSLEDLRPLRYYLENIHYRPDFPVAQRRIDLCGDNGIAILCLPRAPLSRMIVEYSGITFLSFAMLDAPKEIEATFQAMERADDECFDVVCQSPGRFVMFPDNLSSEVVSPRWFERYSLPYYQQRNEQLHAAGKFSTCHLDGIMKGLLPHLAKSGIDCVEGLTPAPVGDLEPEELRQYAGEELILWGGIPGSLFSPLHSEEVFEAYVRRYIRYHQRNSRFVLGVGDQVPPDGTLDRVRKVRQIVDELGE